jgi:hypothetical protein
MSLTVPYPAERLGVARKVVWYDKPEQTLADLKTFLSRLMVYGSSADVAVAKRVRASRRIPKRACECSRWSVDSRGLAEVA